MKKLAATVLTLALAAGTAACSSSGDAATPATTPTVETSFSGLPAPTGDPELAGLADARPAPGAVAWVTGPFDDRFTHHARFDGAAVRGDLDVTSDVSEILDLQVVAGFYDANGAYLGEGRWTLHTVEEEEAPHSGSPDERVRFTVRVPAAYAGKAVAAAAGVTVLVNE